MLRRRVLIGALVFLLVSLLVWAALATDAEMYFSSDKNGQSRVTNVQEGDSVFIVIYDPDENIDCDVRDKIWTDIKVMDPKTGAYIVWESWAELFLTDGLAAAAGFDPLVGPLPPVGVIGTAYKGHYPGTPGSLDGDYLEETGADTGLFVSKRSFRIGTRESFDEPYKNTHVVDSYEMGPIGVHPFSADLAPEGAGGVRVKPKPAVLSPHFPSFTWGNYDYDGDLSTKYFSNVAGYVRGWFGGRAVNSYWLTFLPGFMPILPGIGFLPSEIIGGPVAAVTTPYWLIGRFENMDTLVGLYQDQNDESDVALGMMKIIDTEATIAWDQEVYKDANGAAKITVVDPDENLNCNEVEYVPVFVIVNPGSWNPVDSGPDPDTTTGASPNSFCQLKRTGGVRGTEVDHSVDPGPDCPIRWYNIYNATKNAYGVNGAKDGRYYIQYPTQAFAQGLGWENVTYFDTVRETGLTAVSFYAQETAVNSGIFELSLNSILDDLGFNSLDVGDVLVAYYLDPNDEDDFKLATAYIEGRTHSLTSFTDADRTDKLIYWIGRDPVYVQVIDSNANADPCCPEQVVVYICDPHEDDDGEWWILDETSSNSSVFFSNAGMELRPVWDALGFGRLDAYGGYQLVLDNWKLEVFNEDSVYVRYNDVYYTDNEVGLLGLGDSDTMTAYSGPRIDRVRDNDVSFDLMEIADTQVYDGQTANMYFLDRNGSRVSGYVNSDCVFVEVIDPDQDEDRHRRERVDAYWDGGQNIPFGPKPLNEFGCAYVRERTHPVNPLLGDTNIFNDSPFPYVPEVPCTGEANLYVLNPRSGRWAGIDLMETGVATGDFVSVICIDLASQYNCVPTLGVLPGDTILAVYMDPSNHSDSCWISIKVGIGGGETPAEQKGQLTFVDAAGNAVANYTDVDDVYVKVVDRSHAGASGLLKAVEISGQKFDLEPLAGAANDTFITDAISMTPLGVGAGDTITATYTDPTDPTDVATKSITVIASELTVEEFIAVPNPFETEVTFTYVGSGIATTFSVEVRDLAGKLVWSDELTNVSEVTWDGKKAGAEVASGPYIYVIVASDGTHTFTGKGVFVKQ
jgi:hypothetical protein